MTADMRKALFIVAAVALGLSSPFSAAHAADKSVCPGKVARYRQLWRAVAEEPENKAREAAVTKKIDDLVEGAPQCKFPPPPRVEVWPSPPRLPPLPEPPPQ